jgi:hypothetical protein
MEQTKLEVAKNLLKNGVSIELADVSTGLSIEAIKKNKL